jgi:hypothetical protein
MQDLTRVKHVCMAVRSAAEKEQALKHGIDDVCIRERLKDLQ